jgi:hypothetical protein
MSWLAGKVAALICAMCLLWASRVYPSHSTNARRRVGRSKQIFI